MELINRDTGQPATPAEYAAAEQRAHEIIASPYASPEQIEWALQFPGIAEELVFWESAGERRRRAYAQQEATDATLT